MHVFYLHGFASSPQSSKAAFFSERLASHGVRMQCPDFNEPAFSTLTVSRMLRQLENRIASLPPGDVILIGSSLGGFVAVEAAARQATKPLHPITRLVLLAPAVELEWGKWSEVSRYGIPTWRREGAIDIFHYAYNEPRLLNFDFYEDAQQYVAARRRLEQPLLIFQGRHDESVSPAIVQRFAAEQSNATLHMVDDGHQLKNSFDFIWQETANALFRADR